MITLISNATQAQRTSLLCCMLASVVDKTTIDFRNQEIFVLIVAKAEHQYSQKLLQLLLISCRRPPL